jgi:hypothetical protein
MSVRRPRRHSDQRKCAWLVTLAAGLALSAVPTSAWSAPVVYWCPDRPAEQLYSVAPEPGCAPLVEEKEWESSTSRPPLKSEIILSDVSRFLERYRWFLGCCANDVNSIEAVENLEKDASSLLGTIPPDLFVSLMRMRGLTLTVIMTPVARARDDLRRIAQRLKELRSAEERLATLDFFTAWNERRRLQGELESLVAGIRPPRLPAGPPTGMEIGTTTPHGLEIGVVPPTGPEIGTVPSTGPEIGVTPPTGKEIGQTPPTGFEIGTTGRVGLDIGDVDQKR